MLSHAWTPWYLLHRYIKPTRVSALLCDPRTLHARRKFRQNYIPSLREGPYGSCYARKLTSIYSPQWNGDYIFSLWSTHFLTIYYPAAKKAKWIIFLRFLGVNMSRTCMSNSSLKQGNSQTLIIKTSAVRGNSECIFVFSWFLTTFQSFFLFHFTLKISISSMLDTDLLRSLLVVIMHAWQEIQVIQIN